MARKERKGKAILSMFFTPPWRELSLTLRTLASAMYRVVLLVCTYVFLVNGEVNGEPVKLPEGIEHASMLSRSAGGGSTPLPTRTH